MEKVRYGMAHSPSEAFLDQDTLRQLLATWDQEREQAQVAAEDAQAEVERLSQANASLEQELQSEIERLSRAHAELKRELAHEKAQHSQLVCQFARCYAELLEF